jgi:hypothetical protein
MHYSDGYGLPLPLDYMALKYKELFNQKWTLPMLDELEMYKKEIKLKFKCLVDC